jgi:hypothetical protein
VLVGAQAACLLTYDAIDDKNALTLHRSLRPCARKLDQGLFVIVGFGLVGRTQGLLGILPDLISL